MGPVSGRRPHQLSPLLEGSGCDAAARNLPSAARRAPGCAVLLGCRRKADARSPHPADRCAGVAVSGHTRLVGGSGRPRNQRSSRRRPLGWIVAARPAAHGSGRPRGDETRSADREGNPGLVASFRAARSARAGNCLCHARSKHRRRRFLRYFPPSRPARGPTQRFLSRLPMSPERVSRRQCSWRPSRQASKR